MAKKTFVTLTTLPTVFASRLDVQLFGGIEGMGLGGGGVVQAVRIVAKAIEEKLLRVKAGIIAWEHA